jgi:hypothetical protein
VFCSNCDTCRAGNTKKLRISTDYGNSDSTGEGYCDATYNTIGLEPEYSFPGNWGGARCTAWNNLGGGVYEIQHPDDLSPQIVDAGIVCDTFNNRWVAQALILMRCACGEYTEEEPFLSPGGAYSYVGTKYCTQLWSYYKEIDKLSCSGGSVVVDEVIEWEAGWATDCRPFGCEAPSAPSITYGWVSI